MNDCVPMRIIRLLDEKDDNGAARLIQETPADILSQRMVIGEGEEQWSLSLFEAVAARNRPDHLRALIAKGVSDVDSRDEKGITPLMIAGLEVCPEITRELLIAGASPDLQENEGGGTALHWSIMCMSEDFRPVVRTLLDAGIDYQIRDNEGKTARDHAIEYVSPEYPNYGDVARMIDAEEYKFYLSASRKIHATIEPRESEETAVLDHVASCGLNYDMFVELMLLF